MAEWKLEAEHRETLMGWIAAEYSSPLILHWFQERQWPAITKQAIQYYREQFADEIEAARKERHGKALTTGLARKEERVERLKQHADALEEIKWVPDENGKLWNEKSWRDTLDDIAKEMGHRRQGVDLNVGKFSDEELIARSQAAFDAGAAHPPAGDGAPGPDVSDAGGTAGDLP
jgi:hypothetical protein